MPLGEPEMKNTSNFTDTYFFVEDNARMLNNLDLLIEGVRMTVPPLLGLSIIQEETVGFVSNEPSS